MGIECGCKINKCCHENLKFDNYSEKVTRTSKPNRSSLPIIPEDGRGDSTTIVSCTIIIANIAIIGLLVYVFQYFK